MYVGLTRRTNKSVCIETLKIVNKKKKKGIGYEKNEIFIDVGCDSSGISVNSKL